MAEDNKTPIEAKLDPTKLFADMQMLQKQNEELTKQLEEAQSKLSEVETLQQRVTSYGEFVNKIFEEKYESASDIVKKHVKKEDFENDALAGISMLDSVNALFSEMEKEILAKNPIDNTKDNNNKPSGDKPTTSTYNPDDKSSVLQYIKQVRNNK